jgi:hypothetical protein
MVAVHCVADTDLDAAISERLAAAVDFADIERGDGVVEGHFMRFLPPWVRRTE